MNGFDTAMPLATWMNTIGLGHLAGFSLYQPPAFQPPVGLRPSYEVARPHWDDNSRRYSDLLSGLMGVSHHSGLGDCEWMLTRHRNGYYFVREGGRYHCVTENPNEELLLHTHTNGSAFPSSMDICSWWNNALRSYPPNEMILGQNPHLRGSFELSFVHYTGGLLNLWLWQRSGVRRFVFHLEEGGASGIKRLLVLELKKPTPPPVPKGRLRSHDPVLFARRFDVMSAAYLFNGSHFDGGSVVGTEIMERRFREAVLGRRVSTEYCIPFTDGIELGYFLQASSYFRRR